MMKNEGFKMGNPVWRKYVALQLPRWLEWMANNPAISHVEMIQRFILSNPYYTPDFESLTEVDEVLSLLIVDTEFLESLSDKGAEVWYYSTFSDFVDEVEPFGKYYDDLKLFIRLFKKYIWWFERTYSYFREYLANHLESQGRTFK